MMHPPPKLVEEARRHVKEKPPSGDMEDAGGHGENPFGIETVVHASSAPTGASYSGGSISSADVTGHGKGKDPPGKETVLASYSGGSISSANVTGHGKGKNPPGMETVLYIHPLPQLVLLIQVQGHLVLM